MCCPGRYGLRAIRGVLTDMLFGFLKILRQSSVEIAERSGSDAARTQMQSVRCT
jgi:hypothetical protein